MLIIYSDKVILEDKVAKAYVRIKDGIIQSIDENIADSEEMFVRDYTGCYIMPGIVNISSTNLDKKEIFSMDRKSFVSKIRNIEYSYASSGVSTIYHSIFLNEKSATNEKESDKTTEIINLIKEYNSMPMSIIDNKTHLKFQINSVKTMDDVKFLLDEKLLDFVSYDIKPHYKSTNMYKDQYMQSFIQSSLNLTEDMADKVIERIRQLRDESNIDELAYLIKYAHFKGVKVCTSEYSSATKIYNEFKDTTDIIKITSENSAVPMERDAYFKLLHTSKLLDSKDCSMIDENTILSSDKNPSELLHSMMLLSDSISMHEISKLVSHNPARALGLENVGLIKEGYVADLSVFKIYNDEPVVVSIIKDGKSKFVLDI